MNIDIFAPLEAWFVVGSQHLYGPEALAQVAQNAQVVANSLNESNKLPVKVVFKTVVTRPEEVTNVCLAANNAPNCMCLVCWMHTFSPAKMWIAGLQALNKPFAQLHTQFNQEIPWSTIDMDFMNLNQTAHGGREFGFIGSRMRLARKVIVGHWQDDEVLARLDVWMRAAAAWHDAQGAKFARFGDNMREVAVTEGNKVSAQMQFGYADGLIVRDNILRVAPDSTQVGLYIWGKSKYNANPSRDVAVSGNLITSGDTGISLNGIDGATVGPNRIRVPEGKLTVKVSRGENVVVDAADLPQGTFISKPQAKADASE